MVPKKRTPINQRVPFRHWPTDFQLCQLMELEKKCNQLTGTVFCPLIDGAAPWIDGVFLKTGTNRCTCGGTSWYLHPLSVMALRKALLASLSRICTSGVAWWAVSRL